jgi:hypothetical protein
LEGSGEQQPGANPTTAAFMYNDNIVID